MYVMPRKHIFICIGQQKVNDIDRGIQVTSDVMFLKPKPVIPGIEESS